MDCVWSLNFRKERNSRSSYNHAQKEENPEHRQTAQNMGKQCRCRGASIAVMVLDAEAHNAST